jgi:putative endopeptidase
MPVRTLRLALIPALALAAQPGLADTSTTGSPEFGTFGFDTSGMDRRIDPGEDFYQFANGAWDQRTQIPPDLARAGAFQDVTELSRRETREVVEAAAADPNAAGMRKLVGDMFASFMDEPRIEALGTAPLRPDLDHIAAVRTPSDLAAAFGWLSRTMAFVQGGRMAVLAPIRLNVSPDAHDPDLMRAGVTQGALGLPDRDYYLKLDNAGFAKARTAYETHVARMLTLAGLPAYAAHAHDVVALETAMAQAMWSREQRRDRDKTYNPIAVADLARVYPGFDWTAFLAAGHMGGQTTVNVGEPDAVRALVAMTGTVPLDTWRAYLAFSVINARAAVLPTAFVAQDFEFQKAVSGTPELAPRWKRGVDFVTPTQFGSRAGVGEAVGQLYVAS